MNKKSLSGRLSANPVRISLIEKEERRRTQTLKSRAASTSEETLIPRPRFRSSSVDATGRKSSLKPPARIQQSQYGFGTPQASATTPSTSYGHGGSTVRSLCPGSGVRGRSPSAERASGIALKLTRKDNRPLGDKSFQIEMLNRIDSYLRSIDRSSLVNSSGSLKPITLKMFVEVSDLLVKLLDVKQSLTLLNYVEELPKIAKKLHYPGQINKSWLKTANAMHSWPQVLGWLSWLVETCVVRDLAAEQFQLENLPFIETESMSREMNEIKLQFLLDAYRVWNEEKAEEEGALTEAYLKKVAAMQGVSETDIETAQEECDSETLRLEDAKTKGLELDDDIRQLEETLRALKHEEASLDATTKELCGAEEKYLAEAEAIEGETKVLHDTLQRQNVRREELKKQINSQPMSAVERDEIIERCGAMQNRIKEQDKHLKDIEMKIYTLDLNLASTRNNLNKVLLNYNKDVYLHFDKEAGIDLADFVMPLDGIANPDIMDELERKAKLMAAFKENVEKRNKNVESTIEGDQRKLETLEAEKVRLECEKEERLAKINENKKSIKKIKAAAKAEETELKESIEKLKLEIQEMKARMPNVEQEEKEIAEAKEKIEALIRRKDYLEESARLFFDQFFQIIANHNTRLARLFEEAEESD